MIAKIILSEGVPRTMPLHSFPSAFLVAAQSKGEKKHRSQLLHSPLYCGIVCSKQRCINITVCQMCWLHKIWIELEHCQILRKMTVKQTIAAFVVSSSCNINRAWVKITTGPWNLDYGQWPLDSTFYIYSVQCICEVRAVGEGALGGCSR